MPPDSKHPAIVTDVDTGLTASRVRDLLIYSPEDGTFVWRERRSNVAAGSPAGSIKTAGYRGIKINERMFQASRLAWLWVHGRWPTGYIDHIDGDRANNRLSNLRDVTPTQNKYNSSPFLNSKSGIKGVTWCKQTNKWKARISIVRYKTLHIGFFMELADAQAAYEEKARELRGKFARLAHPHESVSP